MLKYRCKAQPMSLAQMLDWLTTRSSYGLISPPSSEVDIPHHFLCWGLAMQKSGTVGRHRHWFHKVSGRHRPQGTPPNFWVLKDTSLHCGFHVQVVLLPCFLGPGAFVLCNVFCKVKYSFQRLNYLFPLPVHFCTPDAFGCHLSPDNLSTDFLFRVGIKLLPIDQILKNNCFRKSHIRQQPHRQKGS